MLDMRNGTVRLDDMCCSIMAAISARSFDRAFNCAASKCWQMICWSPMAERLTPRPNGGICLSPVMGGARLLCAKQTNKGSLQLLKNLD